MTLFPHLPHTQGIIEISLKPPKTHILYKKREFPHKEHKTNPPHYKKETPRLLHPKVSFLSN